MTDEAVDRVFARSEPHVRETVRALIARARALPDVTVDPKGTCIHLNRRTAFAGLHPRKSALLLNLRARRRSKARASARSSGRRPIAITTSCCSNRPMRSTRS